MDNICIFLRFIFVFVLLFEGSVEETGVSGDTRCCMLEGQNTMMILTEDTQRVIKMLRRKI